MAKKQNQAPPDFITLTDKPLAKATETPLGKQIKLLVKDITQHFAANPDGSWQITLEAARGGGKTSALNMLSDLLATDKKSPYIIVRFNPWDLPDSREPDARRILGHLAVHVANVIIKLDDVSSCLPPTILAEKAGELLPGPTEAGQAAIAFGADTEEFLKVFREKLSSIGAADEYFEQLENVLNDKKKILAILADDVDWRTPISTELLTALSHFRAHKRVLVVCAVNRPWIEAGLKESQILKPVLSNHPEEMPSIIQSLLGQELSLPFWSSSRQIAFFDSPKLLSQQGFVDGRLIWTWFLHTDELTESKQYDKAHKTLLLELCAIDAAEGERIGAPPEQFWPAYQNILENYDVTKKILTDKKKVFIDSLENFAKQKSVNEDNIRAVLLSTFLFGLFPNNPRQAVYLTNRLIMIRRYWKESAFPIDRTFDEKKSHDRLARLLTFMAIEKWRGSPLADAMSTQAWPFRAGIKDGWLSLENDQKILVFESQKAGQINYLTPSAKKLFEKIATDTTDLLGKQKTVRLLKYFYKQSSNQQHGQNS